jgi:hypothetical protein
MATPKITKDDLDLIGADEPQPSRISTSAPEEGAEPKPISGRYEDYTPRYQPAAKLKASLGISAKYLPPITRREIAIYQGVDLHMIDPLSNSEVLDQSISIAGSYVLYDDGEEDLAKRHKRIRNVTGMHQESVDGKLQLVERVDDILFINGFKAVNTKSEYPLYAFLENHPLNASNRNRPQGGPLAFKRVDLATPSISMRAAQMDLAFDAEKEVLDMKKDELFGYANTAGITTLNRPVDEVRYDFRLFSRQHPKKFFGMVPNNEAAIKMNVLDADSLGFIEYKPDKKSWIFCSRPEKPICVHTPGEEPTQALISYFVRRKDKETVENYEFLLDQLKYWDV